MNYSDINDYELLFMIQEQNQDALNIIYDKYYYMVRSIVKKYKSYSNMLGIDTKDLIQEALIAFSDAINSYKDDCNNSFSSFLYLCISRRLCNYIRRYNMDKNKIVSYSIPLDSNDMYESFLSDNNTNNPISIVNKNDNIDLLYSELTNYEKSVFKLYMEGYKYIEIANILNKSYKSIDSCIQRIKNKLKKVIDI